MGDETEKRPDELWSVQDTMTKRTPTNTHIVSGLSWTEVLPSEEAARKRGEILGLGTTREFEPVLIGVSPAIRDERDALRAEVERLEADIRTIRAEWNQVAEINYQAKRRQDAEIASLKAELATLRGEGPIRVGDVVQVTDEDYGIQTLNVMHLTHDDQLGVWGHNGTEKLVWKPMRVLKRVGRAVRMPDGTPVAD